MRTIEKYTINQNFIPNLPQIPYRQGVGTYEGICLHATAVYNDCANGERNYETTHWQDAFVHTFVDETQILQTADFNYISWGCCHIGNQFLINVELCQSHDAETFKAAYDRWVWIAAYLLYQRKLGVTDKVTLWSHKEVSDTYHETDHQDPIEYLAEHGKTWADVVNDVTAYYNQFEQEDNQVNVEDANKIIAVLSAFWGLTDSQEARDELHRLANELRKVSGQPEQ